MQTMQTVKRFLVELSLTFFVKYDKDEGKVSAREVRHHGGLSIHLCSASNLYLEGICYAYTKTLGRDSQNIGAGFDM